MVKAVPAGYADVDGDKLTYRYQWLRNGTAISGATNRTLDLAQAGNGDLGDRIDVDVTAVDASGGTSPAARGHQTITGTNSTPVEGTVAIAPASPKTDQIADGDAGRLPRPRRRGAHLQVPVAPERHRHQRRHGGHARPLAGRQRRPRRRDPGRGLRHGSGRARRAIRRSATVTVANSAPARARSSVKPTAPSTDDIVSASATGFADADGDAVSYQYQWFRNGTAISGATGRTLDLSQAGNGDAGDVIAVEVTALDGNGGTSAAVRGSQTVGVRRLAPGRLVRLRGGRGHRGRRRERRQRRHARRRHAHNAGRFGRALSFDGDDDMVTVPDDSALDLDDRR